MAESRRSRLTKSNSSSPEKDVDGSNKPSRKSYFSKKRTSLARTDNFRQMIRRKSSALGKSYDQSPHDSDSDAHTTHESTKPKNQNVIVSSEKLSGNSSDSRSQDICDKVPISCLRIESPTVYDSNGSINASKGDLDIKELGHAEYESSTVQEYHLEESEDAEESALQQTSQVKDRIQHIVEELLSTEESYVTKLGQLVTIKLRTARLLGEDVAKHMFTNVEVIHTLHHDNFLPQLQKRITSWQAGSCIGDIMHKLTPFLKLYTEYVKNFEEASKLVHSWKSRSQPFNKLTIEFASLHNGGLDIGARMIEPIQRVPRYELLLKDYLKRLPEESPDKSDVERALELVSEATRHFEGVMARDARISMLGQLQDSLEGHVNIFSLSRELVKNADIIMLNQRTQTPEDCSLYLFNDIMLITRDHPGGTSSIKRTKKVKYLLDLSKVQVTRSKSGDIGPSLSVKTRLTVMDIGFKTEEELRSWEQILKHQLAESTKKKLIRRGTWQDMPKKSSLGKTAPTLVPPHTVTVCMVCGAEFTSPKKKKHCSACGMVVCGKCNSNTAKLDYDASASHRVCDKCSPHLTIERSMSEP